VPKTKTDAWTALHHEYSRSERELVNQEGLEGGFGGRVQSRGNIGTAATYGIVNKRFKKKLSILSIN